MHINLKDVQVHTTYDIDTKITAIRAGVQLSMVTYLSDLMLPGSEVDVEALTSKHIRESLLHAMFDYLVLHHARDLETLKNQALLDISTSWRN